MISRRAPAISVVDEAFRAEEDRRDRTTPGGDYRGRLRRFSESDGNVEAGLTPW